MLFKRSVYLSRVFKKIAKKKHTNKLLTKKCEELFNYSMNITYTFSQIVSEKHKNIKLSFEGSNSNFFAVQIFKFSISKAVTAESFSTRTKQELEICTMGPCTETLLKGRSQNTNLHF